MLKQLHGFPILLAVLLLCVILPARLSAQSSDECKDDGARQAWERGDSPVYADAIDLARSLRARGFVVECIRRSKEENLFAGQMGAAWYKTDQGIFEVWFLPKAKSFAALEVIDQPQGNGRYTYSFRGTPRILTHIDSSQPISFLKQGNLLFEVSGNKQLASNLDRAFRKP